MGGSFANTSGSITNAVRSVRRVAGFSLLVNVECQSLEEANEAVAAGANIIMLDNLVGEELHSAAKSLKEQWKGKKDFLVETSGGIVEGGLVARLGPGEFLQPRPESHSLLISRHRHPLHFRCPPKHPSR